MSISMLLCFFLWQAQPNPAAASSQLASIEGRVTHALTGEPIRKAQITLRKRSQNVMAAMAGESTVSDDEGKFRIDKLEPGTYSLYAERAGFVRQEYGARTNSFMGTPITVGKGEEMKISFKLLPQSVIAGRVVNDEGEPVQHAQVMAIRQSGSGGQGMSTGGAATNDIGEFRVANLAPGRYLLRVMPAQSFFGAPPPAAKTEGEKRRQASVPTYYPGVTDAAAASPLEVAPGQQLTGISLTLQKAWVYRVSGKLTAPPVAGRMTRLMLMPRERNPLSFFGGGGGMTKPDGSFLIDNVQPGSYHLAAMQSEMTGGRPQAVARAQVDVTDQDIEGVVLQVQPAVDIAGTVRVDAKEKEKPGTAGMRVTLAPVEGVPMNTPTAAVGADGTFQLSGVMPDRYYLSYFGIPENCYVRAAQFGNEDVLKSGLLVSGGGKLEIVLTTGAATVQGLVQQEEKPYAGGFVMLVPEPFAPQAIHLRKYANSDQNGRYEFKGVAPGEYRLYAWPEPQWPFPTDGEALKPFEDKSVKVKAREGGSEQADVTLIEPPKQ